MANETFESITIGDPNRVAPQITDAVTQANVKVLADTPAMAMGTIYQSLAQSTGLAFANAVSNQHLHDITGQAATTQGVTQLFLVDTIGDSLAGSKLVESDLAAQISALNAAVNSGG